MLAFHVQAAFPVAKKKKHFKVSMIQDDNLVLMIHRQKAFEQGFNVACTGGI